MLKRVISFLLCVNILVSMLPVQSFATEDVTESTEQIVTTEPLEETTEPSEAVTEPSEEVTMPTVAVTEPTEEITVPTEFVVEVTEPEATTESEPVCTGFVDCPVSDHDDGCEKKAADEKAAADLVAADSVAALIDALPSLEEIQAKPVEEQSDDYNQVQAAYDAYEQLTNDQKTLLPPSEEVFKPYFDYFNSLTQETATHSHPLCGSSCSCDSSSHSSETWTVWDGTHRMYSNYGYYYLEEDIVLDSTMILDYGYTTYLCLNGHTITCEDRVFDIYSYRSLLITDCKGTGKIETTGNDCTIGNNKYLSIWGGTILNSGTYAPAIETYNGTTTYVCKGTVESENYAAIDSAPGSKVYIQGGTVAGEYAAIESWGNNSGNVGHLTVSGGTVSGSINWICGNYTMTGGYVNGGVDVDSYECEGSTTISGGIIDGALWNCNEKLTITGGQMELVTYGGNGTISAGIFNGNCQIGGNDMIISAGNFSDCDALNIAAPTWIYGGIFKNIKVNENLLCLSGLPSIETLEISKPNTVSAQNRDNSGSYGGDPIQISLTGTWSDGNVVIKNVTSDAVAQKFTLEDQDAAWKYLERSGNNLVLRVLPGGECGTSATWRLQNGVLTISGTGAITYNYSGSQYPWGDYVDEITRIVVEQGITGIPSYTFEYCENATTIILPDTLTSLALNAFNDCGSLNHLMLPASLTTISGTSNTGNPAFIRCESLTDVYYLGTEREWNAVANSNQVESHNSDMTLHFLVRHDGTATCTQAGTEPYYQFDDTSVYGSMYNADKEHITQLLTVPALGHRVILEEPIVLAPLTVDNTDAVPFALTGDTYYSNNHAHSSSSQLKITAKAACKLTLRYGVSSEANYDKLYIHHNGTQKDMISGSVTEKTMMLTLAAGDVITVRYSKDSSVSSNEDRGWIELEHDIGGSGIEGEVPAELVEPDCTNGVVCDYCGTVVKAALGHQEVADAAVPPTCTEDGLSAGSRCSVCDAVIVAQEVVPAGHTVENGICTQCGLAILGNNLIWTLDENGTLTIFGSGPMPDFEDEYEQPWYYQASSIKKVVIQDGITEIGNYAFCRCNNMTEISVPDSVTSFGSRAFSGCNSLTSIEIPAEQKTIGGFMFSGCSSLTSITIPDGVTSIGDNAFAGSGLTSLVIPDSVMTIGNRAFDGCRNLEEVLIGKNVRSLYERAFAYCSALDSVRFTGNAPGAGANNVFAFSPVTAYYPGTNSSWTEQARQNISYNATWVPYDPCEKGHNYGEDDQCTVCGKAKPFASGQCGESLFWEYDGEGTITITGTGTMYDYTGEKPWEAYEEDITTVVIGAGVTSIGYGAFMSCSELNSVSLPDTLTQISAHGFSYCPALEQIQLPDGLQEIGGYAFSSTGLKAIHLGSALQKIDMQNPFGDNKSLEQITIAVDNPNYCVVDHVLFSKDMSKLICYPGGLSQESYTVPDGVKSIGGGAFSENTNIKTVILPETLEILEDQAFFSCDSLCQLELPSGLQKLGSLTLAHTSLEQIVIPASVTSIGHLAFSNISTLESITFEGDAPEIHSGAFGNDSGGTVTTAYYPSNNPTWTEDKLQNYGGTITWVPYSNEHVHEYGDNHMCECGAIGGTCGENLTWTLVDGVLTITGTGSMEKYSESIYLLSEPWASYRSQIQTVFIDAGVTSVDRSLFYYNQNLTGIYVDENNSNYSDDDGILFNGDKTVLVWMPPVINGTYQIADSVKSIGAYAFSECDGLTSVVIPNSVTSIGNRAFAGLENLNSVTIGDGVTQIGGYAFYYCSNLTDLTLGNGVKNIGDYAFFGCGLTSLVIPDNVTTIGQFAFQGCPFTSLNLGNGVQSIGYWAFSQCPNLASVVLPASVRSIDDGAFWRCSALSEVRFQGEAPDLADEAFSGVNATAYYPANNDTWTEEMRQNYGGTLTWVPYSDIENRLILDSEAFSSYDSVWIDGAEMAIQKDGNCWYIDLPDGNARIMTTYTYHVDDTAEDGVDAHRRYPVSMRVWTLENQNGVYTATRQEDFNDMLQYSGISIRITGKQGIRMITSIETNKKNALISDGLAGYTLKEYGTVVAWASKLAGGNPLILGQSYAMSNYAYKKGVADPVFAYSGSLMQYTNVLVNFSLDQCKNDMAMRPYMILADAQGNEITIYGGIVERSIGYIALRNRFRYPNYSDYYDYVWGIIHHVYGDTYDADWNPEWSDAIM